MDGDELEVVDEFVYLGSLVTAENNTSKEIRKRILAGNPCLFWTTEDPSIESSATPHEADTVQNLDPTGCPLRS